MRKDTLLFLFDCGNNRILLAMKKRGFGAGKFNGVGGKVVNGESIEEATVREAREEISVLICLADLSKKAVLNFSLI